MRILLAAFFFFMYAGDSLGLNVGLGPGLSAKNLLLYMILAGVALNAAVVRNRNLDLPSIVIPFGLLLAYAIATWIVVSFIVQMPDYNSRDSFIVFKSDLVDQFVVFLLFLFGVMNAKDGAWLLRTMIWIVVAGNIVTLIDAFDIPNLGLIEGRVRDDRFVGLIGTSNAYGQFLVLFLPATVALYLTQSGKGRLFGLVGLFATALALLLTGSRGAYVGLLMGAGLAAFFLRRSLPTQILVRATFVSLMVLAVIVSVSIVVGFSDLFIDRFGRFEGSSHVATSGRSTIWTTAIKAMIENPISFLTGNGINAYRSSREFYAATHNSYLTFLYDLGIIGLGLFMVVLSRVLATARSAVINAVSEQRTFFIAFVFGFFGFIISIFFSEYQSTGYLLWPYVGVTMRLAIEASGGPPSDTVVN